MKEEPEFIVVYNELEEPVNVVDDNGAQYLVHFIHNLRDGYIRLCLCAWVAIVEQRPNLVKLFLGQGKIRRV